MAGVFIATRGIINVPTTIKVTVCDKPEVGSVVEVRPKLRQVAGSEEVSDNVPMILSGKAMKPKLRSVGGTPTASSPKPNIIETDELKPVIRRIEED